MMGKRLRQGNCLFVALLLKVYGIYAYNLQHLDDEKLTTPQIGTHKFVTRYHADVESQDYTFPETEVVIQNGNMESSYSNIHHDVDITTPDETVYPYDSWSVVWYAASFGGLIIFFLVVSCSEWCCRRNIRNNCSRTNAQNVAPIPESPPPSYEEFAPPTYESLRYDRNCEKSEYDIYVVPVHALGSLMQEARGEDAPPSYSTASVGCMYPAYPPQVQNGTERSTTTNVT